MNIWWLSPGNTWLLWGRETVADLGSCSSKTGKWYNFGNISAPMEATCALKVARCFKGHWPLELCEPCPFHHQGCYGTSKWVCLETEWKLGFWWKFETSQKAPVWGLSEGFCSKLSPIRRGLEISQQPVKRIPDFSEQKYFLENKFFFSEIPLKHKKVFHWISAWFLTSLLLCFRVYNINKYRHEDFKDSSWVSSKEGLWNQFSCPFPMNFGQSPVKEQNTMLLQIQKLGKCFEIWV